MTESKVTDAAVEAAALGPTLDEVIIRLRPFVRVGSDGSFVAPKDEALSDLITLAESMQRTLRALPLLSQPVSGELPQAWITCPSCDGTRMDIWDGTEHDCTVCNARGVVPFVPQSPPSDERGDKL